MSERKLKSILKHKASTKKHKTGAKHASTKKRGIRGRGDYIVPTSSLKYQVGGESAGSHVGKAIGSVFGHGAFGGSVGDFLHRGFKYLTGHGDYQVRQAAINSHAAPLMGSNVKWSGILPEFMDAGKSSADGIVVCFDEFIGRVTSSQAFNNQAYVIDAANSKFLPWLSKQALCYQQYEIMGMIIYYKSEMSQFAGGVGGALGKVCVNTRYDPEAPAPTSMISAEDTMYAKSGPGTDSFIHIVECKPSATSNVMKYVRSLPSVDKSESQLGTLYVSREGFADTGTAVGSLWCTYKIRLLKQTLANSDVFDDKNWINVVSSGTTAVADGSFVFNRLNGYLVTTGHLDFGINRGYTFDSFQFIKPGSYTVSWVVRSAGPIVTVAPTIKFNYGGVPSGITYLPMAPGTNFGLSQSLSGVASTYAVLRADLYYDGSGTGKWNFTLGSQNDGADAYSEMMVVRTYGTAAALTEVQELEKKLADVLHVAEPETVSRTAVQTTLSGETMSQVVYPYPDSYPFPPAGERPSIITDPCEYPEPSSSRVAPSNPEQTKTSQALDVLRKAIGRP